MAGLHFNVWLGYTCFYLTSFYIILRLLTVCLRVCMYMRRDAYLHKCLNKWKNKVFYNINISCRSNNPIVSLRSRFQWYHQLCLTFLFQWVDKRHSCNCGTCILVIAEARSKKAETSISFNNQWSKRLGETKWVYGQQFCWNPCSYCWRCWFSESWSSR